MKSLSKTNLQWHVWERVEIENYLLKRRRNETAPRGTRQQSTLDPFALTQEFERLLESSRDEAHDRLAKAFQEYGRSRDEKWDAGTHTRKAREFLQQHWEHEKIALADAKDLVLPGMKLWLQNQQLGQFSDKALAEALLPEDLPQEVHDLAKSLAAFAGVQVK